MAACNPIPREPPVTTAVFPARENIVGKPSILDIVGLNVYSEVACASSAVIMCGRWSLYLLIQPDLFHLLSIKYRVYIEYVYMTSPELFPQA